jgi:nickel-dependent lactate racemase
VPGLADIVITNAYPCDLDYWQGIKPLILSQKGLKEKGTLILVGRFPEGVSPSHPELKEYGNRTSQDIEELFAAGKIKDGVCVGALLVHARCIERAKAICVSQGLDTEEKLSLNLIPAATIDDALNMAFKQQGANAKIGIIEYGGDVLPRVKS